VTAEEPSLDMPLGFALINWKQEVAEDPEFDGLGLYTMEGGGLVSGEGKKWPKIKKKSDG